MDEVARRLPNPTEEYEEALQRLLTRFPDADELLFRGAMELEFNLAMDAIENQEQGAVERAGRAWQTLDILYLLRPYLKPLGWVTLAEQARRQAEKRKREGP